jgi:hypothetical protein
MYEERRNFAHDKTKKRLELRGWGVFRTALLHKLQLYSTNFSMEQLHCRVS